MPKFVAHQAVQLNHFEELGHIGDTGSAQFGPRSGSGFIITQGNIDFIFKGTGIQYLGPLPTDGTLTSLDIQIDNASTYKFTGFHIPVQTASNFFFNGNPQQFVSLFLGGNTTIIGSEFDDMLPGGTGNDTIKGRGGNDKLLGGAGNDKLDGGLGTDKLGGGPGDDQLFFSTALDGLVNIDTVSGFSSGHDTFYLDDNIFGGTLGLTVTANEFFLGSAATTADQHLLYDRSNGYFYFDQDGNGTAFSPVQFAVVADGPQVSFSDIIIG